MAFSGSQKIQVRAMSIISERYGSFAGKEEADVTLLKTARYFVNTAIGRMLGA